MREHLFTKSIVNCWRTGRQGGRSL